MKISYNWLKQYIDFKLSPNDLAEVLTHCGLEVESVEEFESVKGGLKGVVIGEVVECGKHPDADKLSLTKVNVGGSDLLQIVCGAPNVAAGQKVVVATVGATLYPSTGESMTMKKAKIRGVESHGMICAEDELGMGSSHDGIMVLPGDAVVGTAAADYFKVDSDYMLEIGLTPNRADAFSHIGVARDLAAALSTGYNTEIDFHTPDLSAFKAGAKKLEIAVKVENAVACPRYAGLCISGLKVGESPAWLKNRLAAIGVRSINNVVDITNYVLHEYGQPLHAFDYDKISGQQVVVKNAAAGTTFKTLDDVERKLHNSDLMICDGQKPMCMAGVFGGSESGVTSATQNIFLESAHFSASSIRKTASAHGLKTDASSHFEKGSDPDAVLPALKRAALLITEICGGEIAGDVIDLYPQPIPYKTLSVSFQDILKLAGTSLGEKTIRTAITKTGIQILKEENGILHLQVPHFKPDVTRAADVVEEILRLHGYNSIPLPKQLRASLSFHNGLTETAFENRIANLLCGAGFSELWTNSITQSKFEQDVALAEKRVMLLNSQTAELDSLRTSMLYSGLEVVARNHNHRQHDLKLFELGKTYFKTGEGYEHQKHLSLFITGQDAATNWITKGERSNFYHLKNAVLSALENAGAQGAATEICDAVFSYGLQYKQGETVVVCLGSVQPKVLRQFDIKGELWYADFNWSYLFDRARNAKTSFSELPKYPAVRRDLSMILGSSVQYAQVEQIAKSEGRKLLRQVDLFDVYSGDKIATGKKSYAVSFVFQDEHKTLTDADVDKVMNKLMKKYEAELGAEIRKG